MGTRRSSTRASPAPSRGSVSALREPSCWFPPSRRVAHGEAVADVAAHGMNADGNVPSLATGSLSALGGRTASGDTLRGQSPTACHPAMVRLVVTSPPDSRAPRSGSGRMRAAPRTGAAQVAREGGSASSRVSAAWNAGGRSNCVRDRAARKRCRRPVHAAGASRRAGAAPGTRGGRLEVIAPVAPSTGPSRPPAP